MSAPFLQLLAHLIVAQGAFERSAELSQLLVKSGLEKSELKQAQELASAAETLFDARLDALEDRITEHTIHLAVTELEMWMQTVRYVLAKSLDTDLVERALGVRVHGRGHVVTVAAQAMRLIAMVRCDDRVADAIGDARKAHDVATRGWALVKKLYRVTDHVLELEADDAGELAAIRLKIEAWLSELLPAASGCAEKPYLLGILGLVPEGVARPVGGASFAVTLHERTRREAPSADESGPCPGWSVGRQQGRNRENLGKGWVEPTFD